MTLPQRFNSESSSSEANLREMLFVSHANPEDNEFALWLSLRLAAEGYPVWCDLTKLLGGEVFWNDIQAAIRDRTAKFLFVLSSTSNQKPGARDELAVALGVEKKENLKDFVIPLWIDGLKPGEFTIELVRRNAIPFQQGWASGLGQLLKKLEDDKISKKSSFGPSSVTAWWQSQMAASASIREEPEPLFSNVYSLRTTPLYFHELTRHGPPGPIEIPKLLPWPGFQHNQFLVSFAPAEDFAAILGPYQTITKSHLRWINPEQQSEDPRLWSYKDERAGMSSLLRQCWERTLAKRKLPTFQFSGGKTSFYFKKGALPHDRVSYVGYGGKKTWRSVVGTKILRGKGTDTPTCRYWHFALEAKPTSDGGCGLLMKPHVIFSDDGEAIWDSPERMHRARRSQCKNWWNAQWRERIAAAVAFMAEGGEDFVLAGGSATEIRVAARPLEFLAPMSIDENSLLHAPTADAPDLEGLEVGEDADVSTDETVDEDEA